MTRMISCIVSLSFSFARRNPQKNRANEIGRISMKFPTAFSHISFVDHKRMKLLRARVSAHRRKLYITRTVLTVSWRNIDKMVITNLLWVCRWSKLSALAKERPSWSPLFESPLDSVTWHVQSSYGLWQNAGNLREQSIFRRFFSEKRNDKRLHSNVMYWLFITSKMLSWDL